MTEAIPKKHAKQLLHEYERTLDSHHTTFSFWRLNKAQAVFAALSRFDIEMIVRPELMALLNDNSVGGAQNIKGQQEGLSQALEWLTNKGRDVSISPVFDSEMLVKANEYCEFASKYVDVADFYKMYLRGQLEIDVDEERKKVRFVWKDGVDRDRTIRGIENRSWERTKLREISEQASPEAFRRKLQPSLSACQPSLIDGRIVLQNPSRDALEPFVEIARLFQLIEHDYVDDNADFVGFSAGDYRRFFEYLRAWSFALQFAFRAHCSAFPDDLRDSRVVPTQYLPLEDFTSHVVRASGLTRGVVESIVERIAYGNALSTPSLYLQPLFISGGVISWSPAVIVSSSYLRNMLKLMARLPSFSNEAANLIGGRERTMLRTLGGWFQREGKCDFKIMKRVQAGGEETDIDLLIHNPRYPEELLLVEGKAVLAPDEINEVDAATEDMQEGQQQLAVAMRILMNMAPSQKQSIFPFVKWNRVKDIYGIVVTPNCEPHQGFDHSEKPAISLATIKSNMRDNHFASPKKFYDRTKARPWRTGQRRFVEQHKVYPVGSIMYELPYGTTVEPIGGFLEAP